MRNKKGIKAAEFFSGVGLVRLALEQVGFDVVYANDIDKMKCSLYSQNFSSGHLDCRDIRQVTGRNIPLVSLATASFPCTDLSLAGNRKGLAGKQSGAIWEFLRILNEMQLRRPPVVLLENVLGFSTSDDGRDIRAAIAGLNRLGYICDVFKVDARHFVPQSRPRLFIVGSQRKVDLGIHRRSEGLLPIGLRRFYEQNRDLNLHHFDLPDLPQTTASLRDIVERFNHTHPRWWDSSRCRKFSLSLSHIQLQRLERLKTATHLNWATAYRRTRYGRPVWEIRSDSISGCLRTARGGSSKQAVVEAGRGKFRVRWMTAIEYCRLQGAPVLKFGNATESQIQFALGDAVCVPAIKWIAENYLLRLIHPSSRFQLLADV